MILSRVLRFVLLYLGGQKRNINRIKTTYVYYYKNDALDNS
jgi:hypothetical protein